jgi:UDP-2-acetamido-3-amino-2,3-dideoxy-glucuronate N-acetyltransferase
MNCHKKNFYVHQSSFVDENVVIGSGTKIWHFSHVNQSAIIGKNCVIGQNVYIGSKAVIGDNVKIQNNVSVYDNVILDDDVFCGPSTVFTNVNFPRSFIEQKENYLTTTIKKGASLGANSTIVCGNDVGRYAFVGAGSVVTKSVSDFALVVGVPAKQIGWVSKSGKRIDQHLKNNNFYIDENTNEKYILQNNNLIIENEIF